MSLHVLYTTLWSCIIIQWCQSHIHVTVHSTVHIIVQYFFFHLCAGMDGYLFLVLFLVLWHGEILDWLLMLDSDKKRRTKSINVFYNFILIMLIKLNDKLIPPPGKIFLVQIKWFCVSIIDIIQKTNQSQRAVV